MQAAISQDGRAAVFPRPWSRKHWDGIGHRPRSQAPSLPPKTQHRLIGDVIITTLGPKPEENKLWYRLQIAYSAKLLKHRSATCDGHNLAADSQLLPLRQSKRDPEGRTPGAVLAQHPHGL